MARQTVRTNLSVKTFPFLSEHSGRGIIVRQYDQNYQPAVTSKEDEDKDIGVPSLFYGHNIIPTSQGYQSVGYSSKVARGELTVGTYIDQTVQFVQQTTDNFGHVGIANDGRFYAVTRFAASSWTGAGAVTGYIPGVSKLTSATVNGVTYIYVANIGCWKVASTVYPFVLTPVTLTGLTASEIRGIMACQGYLIAWSNTGVVWSSLTDPTDFTPSLSTGAGGGSVQEIKSAIMCCVKHPIGFLIYTAINIVVAAYSGNIRYPFNFKEIPSSVGLTDFKYVTQDPATGNHICYTAGGVQTVTHQQTQPVFPELADFLAGVVYEDFNESTNYFEYLTETATFNKRLATVSDRYIIFSYGHSSHKNGDQPYYTYAILYDAALKRWGKLKVTHTHVVDFTTSYPEDTKTVRNSIGFLAYDGTIQTVNLDTKNTAANGVAIFGKFQHVRSRMTQLESVELENVLAAATNVSLTDLYTLNGKTLIQKAGYEASRTGLVAKFLFHAVGVNHSLLLKGAFDLVCSIITYTIHGRR